MPSCTLPCITSQGTHVALELPTTVKLCSSCPPNSNGRGCQQWCMPGTSTPPQYRACSKRREAATQPPRSTACRDRICTTPHTASCTHCSSDSSSSLPACTAPLCPHGALHFQAAHRWWEELQCGRSSDPWVSRRTALGQWSDAPHGQCRRADVKGACHSAVSAGGQLQGTGSNAPAFQGVISMLEGHLHG